MRELILAFRPPWWIEVTYEELEHLDVLSENGITMDEYYDDKFPCENWPIYWTDEWDYPLALHNGAYDLILR